MQTFFPDPSSIESARVLDDARLRKQQVEAEQILKVLSTPTAKGWVNHPAVLQWKGYEIALTYYLTCISKECSKRGFRGRHDYVLNCSVTLPPWHGNDKLHISHKSRLLFKGRVDVAAKALKSLGVKKVNQWLKENKYPSTNQFKLQDIINLEDYLTRQRATFTDNHYRQFWPDLDDTIPYYWPVTKNSI
jgi:hypothetical protein